MHLRSLVNEATAKYWTDAEVTIYKNMGMVMVQARFHPYLSEVGKTFADFTMTATEPDYDAPTDYHKIMRIEVQESGETLRYIEDDEYWKYSSWSSGNPVAWMWKGGQIKLIPTPDTTDTNYLRIWYTTELSSVIDFPEVLRPLIAVEAVISARVKDENVTTDLLILRQRYEEAAFIDLTFAQMQEGKVFADFALEDTYA